MTVKTIFGAALAAAFTLTAILGIVPAFAADTPKGDVKHRVVFHVNAGGEEYWEAAIGNVENLRESLGTRSVQVEVVAHGKGLGLVMATNTALADRMRKLSDGGVAFVACENTMRKKNVTKEQLLPFAKTVDAGVAHVVRRQAEGWSYVKP